jgi:NTP pyrophosphatase (non-canonical NTP hydrolase)
MSDSPITLELLGVAETPALTVRAMQRESYETAKAKGWHDQDDQPPSEAKLRIAEEMLMIAQSCDCIEAYRRGEPLAATTRSHVSMPHLSDRQITALHYLGLIASELAEAADDILANRWETTTDENGKPQGLGSEIADVMIRCGDHFSVYEIDLSLEIQRKFDYNRKRSHRHGGRLA